jgi:hypothetical protein
MSTGSDPVILRDYTLNRKILMRFCGEMVQSWVFHSNDNDNLTFTGGWQYS